MSDRSDLELVSAIALHDVAAFGELYDRHAERLYGLCRRMLHSGGDAEEVLQDAFLQVWRQASRFDPSRASVMAWLVVMTRSRALDRLRAARLSLPQASNNGLQDVSAPGRDAEREVLDGERASHLRQQVDLLSAAHRVPLELAFYEGLTHAEIAEVLCQPLGSVKTRIRLGLLKLRDGLTTGGPPAAIREPSPFSFALSRYLAARVASPCKPSPLDGLQVMVIDDDQDTLDLLKTVLESAGADVVTGLSATAALTHLDALWPDVVLTDIRMPDVDGYSLAEKILAMTRASARALPVIAFTAHGASAGIENAATGGFAAFLRKPSPPRRVVETVAQSCGRAVA